MSSYLMNVAKKIFRFYGKPALEDRKEEKVEPTLDDEAETLLAMQNDGGNAAVVVNDVAVAVKCESFLEADVPSYDLDAAMRTPGCLIDTHCHLDFICRKLRWQIPSFGDFVESYQSEFPASFAGCIAVFCQPDNWLVYGLEDRLVSDANVWTMFGVHPHFSSDFDDIVQKSLENLLERDQVVALGEIGLDFSHKNNVEFWIQENVFRVQLRMGVQRGLPVCLHIRGATMEAFQVIDSVLDSFRIANRNYPLHLHCYTGDWNECKQWLDRYPGLMVGFTPLIANLESWRPIHEAVRNVPIERILIETDAPYFFPNKKVARSSSAGTDFAASHPGHSIHTAAQIAAIKDIALEEVLRQTRLNVTKIYRI